MIRFNPRFLPWAFAATLLPVLTAASALPPGSYRVEVSQKGCKKTVRELEVQVVQVGAADFELEVGDITQSITGERHVAGVGLFNWWLATQWRLHSRSRIAFQRDRRWHSGQHTC